MILAIDETFWQQAKFERKADLAEKISPLLMLADGYKCLDGSKREWRVWEDSRFTDEQLSDIEFWIVFFEKMPTLNGGFDEARAEFAKERQATKFDADTDTLRARRADGKTYMRVYPDALPESWQVFSEELP